MKDHRDEIRPFRILCLSGGGYKGLFTAIILERLERRAGGPLRDRFDIVSGTSIGGVIALAVAAGVPMRDLVHAFRTEGRRIFPHGGSPGLGLASARSLLRHLSRPKYDAAPLREAIARMTGEGMRLADLPVRVALPAVRILDGAPVIFTRDSHPGALVTDVAMATSAAPMMFPTARVGGEAHADGAVFATAPDLVALHEAEFAHGATPSWIRMLSIGALSGAVRLKAPAHDNLGILGWMAGHRILGTVLAAQEQITMRMAEQRLGSAYLRIDGHVAEADAVRLGLDLATHEAGRIIAAAAAAVPEERLDAALALIGGKVAAG
ncbi:CBASS cGAMP-activated phospholipase [Defluviimonas salinarum]|uniref:CBASS cGAMP-activated phospholipase n=1 Tax=Defluviimonas salinarum TaxID=2992147 RepID=A0ABT3J5J4_9RHOB|nr:CBASS cGAMP-activated phospholipase [Defluviimonas salinarum]MCW3782943.1 CBASS cGAMP-activated phospholipase [Defluviimonas salinarum]